MLWKGWLWMGKFLKISLKKKMVSAVNFGFAVHWVPKSELDKTNGLGSGSLSESWTESPIIAENEATESVVLLRRIGVSVLHQHTSLIALETCERWTEMFGAWGSAAAPFCCIVSVRGSLFENKKTGLCRLLLCTCVCCPGCVLKTKALASFSTLLHFDQHFLCCRCWKSENPWSLDVQGKSNWYCSVCHKERGCNYCSKKNDIDIESWLTWS